MWVIQVIIYAVIVGFFTVIRKQASEKTNISFVLAMSSTVGFLLIGWNFATAVALDWLTILLILVKSSLIACSWQLELVALKKYYLSTLQPFSVIRIIITFFASMIIFSEEVFWYQFIGVAIVLVGLFFLNKDTKKDINQNFTSKQKTLCILLFILSCVLAAISSVLDKYIMTRANEFQMQIWYMLFVSVLLWIAFFAQCIYKKQMLVSKSDWANVYIYLTAVLLILCDQFLFRALADPASKNSIISVLRQISVIVAVIYGGLLYKEPYLKERLVYLAVMLCGIVIILI